MEKDEEGWVTVTKASKKTVGITDLTKRRGRRRGSKMRRAGSLSPRRARKR